MKVLIIGDVHLSDRPPSVRTDTYAEDILAKLAWCMEYANEHADLVLQLGDVFHVKAPSRTSHWLVQRTAETLQTFKGRVLIVPGNHDLSQDRLESIPSQPIGTLALTPNVTLLDGFDAESGIFGIPYLDDLREWLLRLSTVRERNPKPILIAAHAPIFPTGLEPPYAHLGAEGIATGGVPLAYGHIHDPFGVFRGDDAWICNNGAISRGSLHEETLKRKPVVTMFDSEVEGKAAFTPIPIPHRPAEDVFRLAEVAEKKRQEQKLDEFLSKVGEVSLTSLSMEEIVAHADGTDLSPKAKAELREIIESVL